MTGTFWALVPAIVAIALALISKEVYSSLFVGIVIGGIFYAIDAGTGFTGFMTHVFTDGFAGSLADAYNVGILVFLVILGLPVMVCEFAVGHASRKSMAAAFKELEPEGTKWHWYSGFAVAGNYLLMMFYTVVSGWFLKYFVQMIGGKSVGLGADEIVG